MPILNLLTIDRPIVSCAFPIRPIVCHVCAMAAHGSCGQCSQAAAQLPTQCGSQWQHCSASDCSTTLSLVNLDGLDSVVDQLAKRPICRRSQMQCPSAMENAEQCNSGHLHFQRWPIAELVRPMSPHAYRFSMQSLTVGLAVVQLETIPTPWAQCAPAIRHGCERLHWQYIRAVSWWS